ncbi:hypothetical protein D3C78_365050 [compost metagenome]
MLAEQALAQLRKGLASAIASMEISGGKFGHPEQVAKQAVEAEKLFQGYAKARPSKENAYAAALAFLREQSLDSWQRDMVASALAEPIREYSGATVLASPKLKQLLGSYEEEVKRGELWRLTWYGLLMSYFAFDHSAGKGAQATQGWEVLREFLARTWPLLDRQAGSQHVPDWLDTLRREAEILSALPADKYAKAYLAGDTEPANRIAADLGVPPSSWFWHALVLGAVRSATASGDDEFRQLVPRLIQLIQNKPVYRDEAVELILVRYHQCKEAPQDELLRDFVVQPTVWKNPKLRAAGIATAWNRVPEPVWQMVLGWVNERNLKDFFDILAARNKADQGRLAFWSQYLKQISWTRLIFGSDTMALKNTNAAVRNLIASEEGAYARLTENDDVDAFVMRIGKYIAVEFSKKPNAAYLYKEAGLKFDLHRKYFSGGTVDLKYGHYDSGESSVNIKIVHTPGWEGRAAAKLKQLGIEPDRGGWSAGSYTRQASAEASHQTSSGASWISPDATRNPAQTQPKTIPPQSIASAAGPDMDSLAALVRRYPSAWIDDKRSTGGRLWVEDSSQGLPLATELKSRGFKWANKRQAWYY